MFYRRQTGSKFVNPLCLFYKLALWTMSVPARVIRLPGKTTLVTIISPPANAGQALAGLIRNLNKFDFFHFLKNHSLHLII